MGGCYNGVNYIAKIQILSSLILSPPVKLRSFQSSKGNSCGSLHKTSLIKFWVRKRLRVCLYVAVQMIILRWLSMRAEGLEKHKKLKCKMVCYLKPGRSVGTRCYLYVGNGLSHLGAQITDLLSFSPSRLDITGVFIILSTHCHLNDSASPPQSDA